MPTTALNIFLNNMELLVHESFGRRKAVEHQVLTKQLRSIALIKNLFMRSSTVVTFQPRAPTASVESVTASAPLQCPPTGDDVVPTPAQQQGAAGTSEDVVTAALEEEGEEAVAMATVEHGFSTQNIHTRHQQVDVTCNKENYDNENDKTSSSKKLLRFRAPVDDSLMAISTGNAFPLRTASSRCQFDNCVQGTLFVRVASLQFAL